MSATAAARSLLTAAAVRERAHRLLALGDLLPNFQVDLSRLQSAAQLVIDTTRAEYPSLKIPIHSRWRHFEFAGTDRWAAIERRVSWPSPEARSRAMFDLAIISVLLDAGAGPVWRFHDDASGEQIGRSEGLALASLSMFEAGVFSARADEPLRADGEVLVRLSAETLRKGFQVSSANPLNGLEGRAALLRELGCTVMTAPHIFGRYGGPRPGGLFDHLVDLSTGRRIEAAAILAELLTRLGPIWPSRLMLGGISLGDCWRHSALHVQDESDGLVPLHKLSQWLAYSLVEPLQAAGVTVTDIDGLTGLAEYRNGGLFIDTGVLTLRVPDAATHEHTVGSELVVEWRALTVALLDRLADVVREKLKVDRERLPLTRILQGGTWAAGRRIARKLRADGSPPLTVVSDGTVF